MLIQYGGARSDGLHREERVAVEDQRDDPDVEHSRAEPDDQAEQEHVRLMSCSESAGELRPEDGDRLGSDDRHQPAAVDPLGQRRLVVLHRQHGEDAVGEDAHRDDADDPQRSGDGPERRRRSGTGFRARTSPATMREEADAAAMVHQIGDERVPDTGRSAGASAPTARRRRRVQPKQARPTSGIPSRWQAIETMPVAITIAKYAGCIPARGRHWASDGGCEEVALRRKFMRCRHHVRTRSMLIEVPQQPSSAAGRRGSPPPPAR